MNNIYVDFKKSVGEIKPMHAVNNGPVKRDVEQIRENFSTYKAAKIPYARNHDASFYSCYGGEHTVDVHAIFPDFSKNPYDESSYDFTLTDEYLQTIADAGTETFYRLGSKIEHWSKKYGTIVPADFKKWAVVCEHIIRHYNEGWAHGFHYNITYWEIWNEADGKAANGDQPNWSGTMQEYYELYEVTAAHLKSRFPNLKIGGPALSGFDPNGKWEDFLKHMTANGKRVPLDFFSWHIYTYKIDDVMSCVKLCREALDRYGYTETENILNEYNFLYNFTDRFVDSILAIIGIQGAAFTSALMAACQKSSLDMLMYYDASPCVFNGLFDLYTLRPLKGYYPFKMFSTLYELKSETESSSDNKDLYVVSATDGKASAAMITYYCSDKNAPEKIDLSIQLKGIGKKASLYLLDKDNDCTETDIDIENETISLSVNNNTVILIENC